MRQWHPVWGGQGCGQVPCRAQKGSTHTDTLNGGPNLSDAKAEASDVRIKMQVSQVLRF